MCLSIRDETLHFKEALLLGVVGRGISYKSGLKGLPVCTTPGPWCALLKSDEGFWVYRG